MNFLNNAPKFLFFTGKGGVGKTSISCSTAINLADADKKVLLVSTDPASNIGQVFDQPVSNLPTAIKSVKNLFAIDIDPAAAAVEYRERILGPVRDILPKQALLSIEEQLSGACTTEIAAFDEFTGLLTNQDIVNQFDHIIFDTAPTGHTIRLLQLPGAWSGFIEENPDGASCLGPLSGLEKQRSKYAKAVATLGDNQLTRLVLVSRPQSATLNEVSRTYDELSALGILNHHLVINGIFPESAINGDALAHTVWKKQQDIIDNLPENLKALPLDKLLLKERNMVGVEALRQLFETDTVLESPSEVIQPCHADIPDLNQIVEELSAQKNGLVMLMGKGGVGKTTLAAALAVRLAEKGLDVHLTTSDPAAHINETLNNELTSLTISRIDPVVETERYTEQVLATKGKDLDAQGRAFLEEDLRSPCTEEVAVFQAFSRVIRDAEKRIVIMDTAPTGHTLMLLDATGSYHKEIERQLKGRKIKTPMMRLQDPLYTKVIIVTLPETTPVMEAKSLQEDLRRAGIEPWSWVVNNSLLGTNTKSPLLMQRAMYEQNEINKVQSHFSKRVALVALQEEEPKGVVRLKALASRGTEGHSSIKGASSERNQATPAFA